MDRKLIVKRIDELIEEKHITNYQLRENAEISSTIYQWRKNTKRDATRTPSLRSIEKVCDFFQVSLGYFFTFDKAEQRVAVRYGRRRSGRGDPYRSGKGNFNGIRI